jgi:hypothetical protein
VKPAASGSSDAHGAPNCAGWPLVRRIIAFSDAAVTARGNASAASAAYRV